ncbi:MAG: hypothetical protein K8L97_28230 [Anaerolineae bacterium]|nr:hypothetical protein [Anaerolineae bacterium]
MPNVQIAILTDTVQSGQVYETTYGKSAPIREFHAGNTSLLVCSQGLADPRATIQALKDQGMTHLWLCESVGALSPLLEPGDWLIPDDFIDGTRGQHYTYFSEKAGGFVQQVPPFDPASREALFNGAKSISPRPFQRGVYVCVSNTRLETSAEAAFWGRAGGHVVGRFLSPCLTLARELEIQVAVLTLIVRSGGQAGKSPEFERYAQVVEMASAHLLG